MEEYSWSLKCCITLIHRKMFIINQYMPAVQVLLLKALKHPTSCTMFLIELCFRSWSGRILAMTLDNKAWVTLGHFIGVNQWIPLNFPSTSI